MKVHSTLGIARAAISLLLCAPVSAQQVPSGNATQIEPSSQPVPPPQNVASQVTLNPCNSIPCLKPNNGQSASAPDMQPITPSLFEYPRDPPGGCGATRGVAIVSGLAGQEEVAVPLGWAASACNIAEAANKGGSSAIAQQVASEAIMEACGLTGDALTGSHTLGALAKEGCGAAVDAINESQNSTPSGSATPTPLPGPQPQPQSLDASISDLENSLGVSPPVASDSTASGQAPNVNAANANESPGASTAVVEGGAASAEAAPQSDASPVVLLPSKSFGNSPATPALTSPTKSESPSGREASPNSPNCSDMNSPYCQYLCDRPGALTVPACAAVLKALSQQQKNIPPSGVKGAIK